MGTEFTLGGVQFSLLDLMMAVILLAAGVYCIYTAIRVRRECGFFESKVLLPGNCKAEDCTDPEGFFDFIFPRMLIFGIGMIFCAALEFATIYLVRSEVLGAWAMWAQLVVPFGFFGWFLYIQRKAGLLYW